MRVSQSYPPIGNYAVVGDCHTAALIDRHGSVDWFCPGRFDAPAVFCRLLDNNRGGYLLSVPTESFTVERRYRGPTNVLETTFSTASGRVRLTDLMPVHQRTTRWQGHDVGASGRFLRQVEVLEGEVELSIEYRPTFDYARANTQLESRESFGAIARAGTDYLTLACGGLRFEANEGGALSGRLCLKRGDKRWLVLTYARDPERAEEALAPVRCEEQLARTLQYWERWAERCTYHGPYRDQVLRSALVLKLLTYEPSGAVVAAPTSSLPENIGGERNWDYRYTWLRDSSLILYALLTIGYADEAADFMHWLERAVGTDPTREPQIMYAIDGRRDLPEQVLEHLAGYRGSQPVRIGNGAATQRQLDIYGEVVRSAALHYRHAANTTHGGAPSGEAWKLLRDLANRAADEWKESGSGIWEVRGGPRSFLYGKLMCWSALDSAIRLAQTHQLEAPLERWQHARDQLREAIEERGYNDRVGAFTQAFGSSTLDATALAIPRIGFLPPTDPRVLSTIEQVRRHLTSDGLVYRYRTEDGLAGGEGTFTLCTFWLVDALALSGRLEEAHELFERVLSYANDLGLLAEEIDPDTREQLGNFPQGFSHLALIGAAVNLAKVAKHGSEQHAETESERADRASQAATEGYSARGASSRR